jgi:acetyltransferase
MSTYRLDRVFSPQSIAVVGGSPRINSLGHVVLRNLRSGQFPGSVHLVNPHHREIAGLRSVAALGDLPSAPDLVVITVPPVRVPAAVAAAGEMGVAGAIIITAGLGHGPGSLAEAAERAARAKGLRLIGPNCLGVMVPHARLNATFAAGMPLEGNLALISQSGAIGAGMVEWASQRAVGFSAMASIGDQLDVDLGDLLDFFALDRHTRAILLYIESVKDARKFMSAARAAARTKPVVVVKAGRHAQGAKAAATHTGALAGSDAVYDAAFRRAGLLRVLDLGELFDAAETLGRVKTSVGKRLSILTNGGGIGVLAIDCLIDLGGVAAELSSATRAKLDAVLPPTWSNSNPIDVVGDADASRYVAALQILMDDGDSDAVLVMNVPTALALPSDIAAGVSELVTAKRKTSRPPKPIFATWLGANEAVADTFNHASIPHYATEVDAVRGFMHLVRYGEGVRALMETPPSLPEHFAPDRTIAERLVEGTIIDGRTWLDPIEIATLFSAYGIPMVQTALAKTPVEARRAAAPLLDNGDTVVVKLVSRDITHKSDVGGVRLNLATAAAVQEAAEGIIASAKRLRPDSRITGVIVQRMIARANARELIAGIADDPTFGPVVVFGRGGTAVEVIDDKALALPPLDLKLARELIGRTRVARILRAYRDVPAARIDDVALVLVKLAQLAADLPQVREVEINPLLADGSGVLAVDARVAVDTMDAKFRGATHSRFAIRPYPSQWERRVGLADGLTTFMRPVRPEDEPLFQAFFAKVSPEDLRLRFFAPIKDFSHIFVARLTQLDYARAMAFLALDEATQEMIGVVRLHANADYDVGEYAVLVRSDFKGRGLGWKLMELIVEYARHEGMKRIKGQVLRDNTVMLRMCEEFGFRVASDPEDAGLCVVTKQL